MRIREGNAAASSVYRAMGRRVKVAETKAESDDEKELVKNLTGQILDRAAKLGWKRHELAARAKKKSASTLYGWRNKSRQNPSLLDLRAYALAVGLDVRLVPQDAASATAGGVEFNRRVGGSLRPDTAAIVEVLEGEKATDELRSAIKKMVFDYLTERATHPPDADAEQAGHRARSSKK